MASDITHVAIGTGFVYLAVILAAWSRKVVGYGLGRNIDTRLTRAALNAAIRARRPLPGCVFHTDRGAQYAASWHRRILKDSGFVGSMSRRGKSLRQSAGRELHEDAEGRLPLERHRSSDNGNHASTTDPEARLFKKSPGAGARLCFMGHTLENRNGLVVQADLSAGGRPRRTACRDRPARSPFAGLDAPPHARRRVAGGCATGSSADGDGFDSAETSSPTCAGCA